MKRLFDIVFATLALVVLSPVLVIVGIWVRLDSAGPVLFRQERVGRFGRLFTIFKFRTMRYVVTPDSLPLTVDRDPRITRAGMWLRRSKIDELPQLVNVLRGEMSIVGPRPEMARYVALYPPEVRALVLSVRPGLTDEAAIEFRDEGALLNAGEDPEQTYVTEILPRKLELYEHYVRNQSIRLDIALILRTMRVLLD